MGRLFEAAREIYPLVNKLVILNADLVIGADPNKIISEFEEAIFESTYSSIYEQNLVKSVKSEYDINAKSTDKLDEIKFFVKLFFDSEIENIPLPTLN